MNIVTRNDLLDRFSINKDDIVAVASLKAPQYFEVSNEARLYIPATGGRRQEFAQAFQDAWYQVPNDCRLKMVEFWTQSPAYEAPWSPQIAVIDALNQIGNYNTQSRTFDFNYQVVKLMAPGLMRQAVGHELGHAWHHPIKNSHLNRHGASWRELECEADIKATAWGFDMSELRRWSNENRKTIWDLLGCTGEPPDDAFLLDCEGVRSAVSGNE